MFCSPHPRNRIKYKMKNWYILFAHLFTKLVANFATRETRADEKNNIVAD
jgi:hypothetical protein